MGGSLNMHLGADERPDRCTCPPMVDVMRGHVVQTREPCPVHPEPTFPEGTFIPIVRSHRRGYGFAVFEADPPPNGGLYGMGV